MTDDQKLKMAEGKAKKKAERDAVKIIGSTTSAVNSEAEVHPIETLSLKMDKMVEGLNSVSGALVKLVELQSIVTAKPVEPDNIKPEYTPKIEDETYPEAYMPPKFRKIVDTVLSPEFQARVVDFPDRTDFQLDIFVPDRFSSVVKIDKERGVQDIRTRIIPRALGENGVREWCELIRKNLNRYYQKEGIAVPFSQIGTV